MNYFNLVKLSRGDLLFVVYLLRYLSALLHRDVRISGDGEGEFDFSLGE